MNGRAYSYVRFSTPEQAKGHSAVRQQEACDVYCQKHGLQLASGAEYTFLDAGRSAYKGEHLGEKGQLARFLRLVENGTIEPGSTLIVESLDRLSRQDVWKALPQFMALVDAGIRVVTLKDERVYSKESGTEDLLMSIFVFSRANEESSQKADRLASKYAKKREEARGEKKPMGRVCPMWLRLTEAGTAYEQIPEHVEAVRRIFELTIRGYGKTAIAKILNEEGFATLKQGVTGWGTSAVHHVVKNRAVLGELQPFTKTLDPARKKREPAGDPIKDYFPAIIPESMFYEAQAAIAGRRTAKATRQSVKFNVWQGVGKCIHCGSSMHMVNKGRPPKGFTYIECSIGRKGLCESHKLIRLDHSEQVFRLLLARLDSMALVRDAGAKLSQDLRAIEGRLLEQREKLAAYGEAFRAKPSALLAQIISETEESIGQFERDRRGLLTELAAEDAIGFDTFMQRLDLDSYEGRSRANALMKRLNVLVFAGREGFMVSDQGKMTFGVAYREGKAGYLELSPWHRQSPEDPQHVAAWKALNSAGPVHSALPEHAGPFAYELDESRDQGRYDAIRDEGQPAGEY